MFFFNKRIKRLVPQSVAAVMLLVFSCSIAAANTAPTPGVLYAGQKVQQKSEEQKLFDGIIGNQGQGNPIDWDKAYITAPSDLLSNIAQTALEISKKFKRADVKKLIGNHKDGKNLLVNLDVGRHEIIKLLFKKAVKKADADLQSRGLSPLNHMISVNSGGTGNYVRDQDLTVFAEDSIREKAFFNALESVSADFGLKPEVSAGGLTLGGLEVTLFPGGNDLPDARFAKDAKTHIKEYRKALQKQMADPEAYKGAGWKLEVFARRIESQAHVQQFNWSRGEGKVAFGSKLPNSKMTGKGDFYIGYIPSNSRELRGIFNGTADVQAQKWEMASYISNNALQSLEHSKHTKMDLSKGPLKYTARTLNALSAYYGMNSWDKMKFEDKMEMVGRVIPGYDKKRLTKMVRSLNVAWVTKARSKLPSHAEGKYDVHSRIAMIFQRKAVAATTEEMARAMLDPPAFDFKKTNFTPGELKSFYSMTPEQKHKFMIKRDSSYKKAVSFETMENLLMTMVSLRKLDYRYDNKKGKYVLNTVPTGQETIRMIRKSASKKLRPLINLAADYANVYNASLTTTNADALIKQINKLYEIRGKLEKRMNTSEAPGTKLIKKMSKVKPQKYIANEEAGKPSMLGRAMLEINARFQDHIKNAFPSTADAYKEFRRQLTKMGPKNYIKRRIAAEAFQMDTIADGLRLVEMYQGNASAGDYAYFALTNILGRFHWSSSHFIAAAGTRTTEDLKFLGKNIFFATAARLIPGSGTVKVVFDIAQGTVNVTAGYVIKSKNAETVDAIYTGPVYTGPVNKKHIKEGTVANARKESGFSVLQADHFKRVKNKDTGVDEIVVNRPVVYADFFSQWTGMEHNDLPRKSGTGKDPAFLKAHDALVDLIQRQAEKNGPIWIKYYQIAPRKHYTVQPSGKDFEKAINAFYPHIEKQSRKTVLEVLNKGASRTYKSFLDKNDVIEQDLTGRLANDIFAGLMEAWETQLTAQLLAKREIERTAMNADFTALARILNKEIYSPARKKKKPAVKIDLQVMGTQAAPQESPELLDGAKPIVFNPVIKGTGEAEDLGKNVVVKVKNEKMVLVKKAPRNESDGPETKNKIGPGDIVKSEVEFVVVDEGGSGEELATRKVVMYIKLPEEYRIELKSKTENPKPGQEVHVEIDISGGTPPFKISGHVEGTLDARDGYFIYKMPDQPGKQTIKISALDDEGENAEGELAIGAGEGHREVWVWYADADEPVGYRGPEINKRDGSRRIEREVSVFVRPGARWLHGFDLSWDWDLGWDDPNRKPLVVFHGVKKHYLENGEIGTIITYKFGVAHGMQRYYEMNDGKRVLREEVRYENGLAQESKEFSNEGELKEHRRYLSYAPTANYQDDCVYYMKEIYYKGCWEEGKATCGEGWEGKVKRFKDGLLESECMYKMGVRYGLQKEYYPSGVLESEGIYDGYHHQSVGTHKLYYESGQIRSVCIHSDKANADCICYEEDGKETSCW